jgi:hypothetical protein
MPKPQLKKMLHKSKKELINNSQKLKVWLPKKITTSGNKYLEQIKKNTGPSKLLMKHNPNLNLKIHPNSKQMQILNMQPVLIVT